MQSLCVREFGEIHSSDENYQEDTNIDKIYLNDSAFKELEKFAKSDDKNTRFVKRYKKSSILKVQNFVGIITTNDGTQIEILPKISNTKSTEKDVKNSRKTLEKMLKVVNNLPFITTTSANLQLANKLLEFVISMFLQQLDNIIKRGIRKDYSILETQEKFLKGQLQTHKQLNEPPHKQHLFHIKYSPYSINRAENRLILSALLQIIICSEENKNQKLAKHFLGFFDGISPSHNYVNDFKSWSNNREMSYYQNIFPWLELLLNRQSPFTLKGKNKGISFLIPMEVLFEKYVTKVLAKDLPNGYTLKRQISIKYLSDAPKAFLLKPDIAIYKYNKLVSILDTKWKLINENKKHSNGTSDNKNGISQSDVYQLFTYGKKYGVGQVALIYPKWEKFSTSFDFKLDGDLSLKVCSFAL